MLNEITAIHLLICLATACVVCAADGAWTLLDRNAPGVWDSDGLWEVGVCPEGVQFVKDQTPMHNSMCWTKLAAPLKRGQTVEIRYRMEVPYKHVDLALGLNVSRRDPYSPLPPLEEIISLGNIASTDWQVRRLTITSNEEINSLVFMCWGWPADRGTWVRVARIRVLPPTGPTDWFVWNVPPRQNPKTIPTRSALQDFFPFGVYLPWERASNYTYEALKDRWEWFDRALADIKARGLNFTSVVNLPLGELDRLAQLHEKHGLRMNPQIKQFDLRYNDEQAVLKQLRQTVTKYRGRSVIAGWAVGEEFSAKLVEKLNKPYDIVHAADPRNTMVTIQNTTEGFCIAGESVDVRIMFRDIYPFYGDPANGPTTVETSLNYYEDELNKCQRLLPRGASLWVMPQAMHIYTDPGRGQKMFVYRMPTPAEVRLQTWVALGLGAKGIAYYVYSSLGPRKPGEPPFELGLRSREGKATPQLDALEELAKALVPLGSTIVWWERTQVAAATDRRQLRAYLFRGGNNAPYLVAYNRDVAEAVRGRVRVPFAARKVRDLVAGRDLESVTDGDCTVVTVELAPGDGTILELSGRLPEVTPTTSTPKPLPADEPPDFVPLGAYLSWERPALCAAYYKGLQIPRWEPYIDWGDVGRRLDATAENHVDTLWVANLLPRDLPQLIRECERRGLKLLANLATVEVKKRLYPVAQRRSPEQIMKYYDEEIPSLVRLAGGSDALVGWVLSDEPNAADLEVVEQVRLRFRKYDPGRFCLVVSQPGVTPQIAERTNLPVVCSDIYPFCAPKDPNGPGDTDLSTKSYFQQLARKTVGAVRGKNAVAWIMGMCFNEIWGPRRYDERGHLIGLPGAYLHWRCPTLAEMRWQVWETLRNGAKGVFIYTLAPEAPDAKTETLPASPPANVSADILAKKPTDLGPNALTNPDCSPTPQLRELGRTYQLIGPHKALIQRWRPAPFGDAGFYAISTNFQCFQDPANGRHYALVVNQDLRQERAIEVRLEADGRSLHDIVRRQDITLSDGMNPTETRLARGTIGGVLTLAPGEGAILRIERAGAPR